MEYLHDRGLGGQKSRYKVCHLRYKVCRRRFWHKNGASRGREAPNLSKGKDQYSIRL